ncbi:unnamed protein product, partial [Cyprideis torosa]
MSSPTVTPRRFSGPASSISLPGSIPPSAPTINDTDAKRLSSLLDDHLAQLFDPIAELSFVEAMNECRGLSVTSGGNTPVTSTSSNLRRASIEGPESSSTARLSGFSDESDLNFDSEARIREREEIEGEDGGRSPSTASLHSLLSDFAAGEQILDALARTPSPASWGLVTQDDSSERTWQERCMELELSLQRNRDQAAKIKKMMGQKLSELELRVVAAESRADSADEKVSEAVREMEHRVSQQNGLSISSQPRPRSALEQRHPRDREEDIISSLQSQIEEQLDFLRNRLAQINNCRIERGTNGKVKSDNLKTGDRGSTEDSSRGSYEGESRPNSNESSNTASGSESHRLPEHIMPFHRRMPSDPSHTSPCLYAEVDVSKKRSNRTSPSAGPPRVVLERKRLPDSSNRTQGSVGSSPSDEQLSAKSSHDSKFDSGSVDLETPLSLSPPGDGMGSMVPPVPVPPPRTTMRGGSSDLSLQGLNIEVGTRDRTVVRTVTPGGKILHIDNSHDYAEIYTPSKESLPGIMTMSAPGVAGKPPTPPLHRFPSWESRIYQIAKDGLQVHSDESYGKDKMLQMERGGYCHFNIPVYATIKGRASQIRPIPFSGEESTDSSDEEGSTRPVPATRRQGPTPVSTASSVDYTPPPSARSTQPSPPPLQPASPNRHPRHSPRRKNYLRETSVDSEISTDYALPPDALAYCDHAMFRVSSLETPKRELPLEKSGYLSKLGGKLKSWNRRWFVLKNGHLSHWKSHHDVHKKPQGSIPLDDTCRVVRAENASTFEVSSGKKTLYLTADNVPILEEWVRVLQNVVRRNATKLLLAKEDARPTLQGWITKVKHGHAKK